jgi:hypothetical protein
LQFLREKDQRYGRVVTDDVVQLSASRQTKFIAQLMLFGISLDLIPLGSLSEPSAYFKKSRQLPGSISR